VAAPHTPLLAADIVIELIDHPGHPIVLVERKNPPRGWALPGGFVDVGEAVEEAAMREAAEETGLEVLLKDLLGVYSNPVRDPRGHTVSVVFVAVAVGEPKAGDDAAALQLFVPDRLPEPLAFDHAEILADYRRYRETGKTRSPSIPAGAPPHGISPLLRGRSKP
jgi:8-oxo-dGTP diphosphatase